MDTGIAFSRELVLWCVGIIQPATAFEIFQFYIKVKPETVNETKFKSFQRELERCGEDRLIFSVQLEPRTKYSLTQAGNSRLSKNLRHTRDSNRLLLLKKSQAKRSCVAGEQRKELAGVSPAMDERTKTEARRPIKSTAASVGRLYWPPLSEQLKLAGPSTDSPATHLDLYSFSSWAQIRAANESSFKRSIGGPIYDLSSAIGISPRLITSIIHSKKKHYRHFKIPKKSGDYRDIASPRAFLKVIQYWLNDYILHSLPVDPAVYSFKRGASIVSNASPHVAKAFVANIDIKDFFGSITDELVAAHLGSCGLSRPLARTISQIVTLNGSLPQGAPTSPILSNSILFKLDNRMRALSSRAGCAYTRYADDITISGKRRDDVSRLIKFCAKSLGNYGMKLQARKTRIASKSGRQVVTGLVVNQQIAPPRKYRRLVRAMFHRAVSQVDQGKINTAELSGHISFLESVPYISGRGETSKYKAILSKLLGK